MWSTWWSRRRNASSSDPESKALSARVEARVQYFTRGRVTRGARGDGGDEPRDGPLMRAVVWALTRLVDIVNRHRL